MEPNTALELAPRPQQLTIYDRSNDVFGDIKQMGQWITLSGLAGCEKSEAGMVLALHCFFERKSPLEIIKNYHIIDRKLSKKSMSVYAEFRAKGARVQWIKDGSDGIEAIAKITFEGNESTHKFTIEDAKKAGLVKPNSGWTKTPSNMLRARVLTNAVGMLCPEIYTGDEPADEVIDVQSTVVPLLPESPATPAAQQVIDVTPAPIAEAPAPARRSRSKATLVETPAAKPVEAATVAPAPAQEAPAATESAVETLPPFVPPAPVPTLPEADLKRLENICLGCEGLVNPYLVAKGKIKAGETFRNITADFAGKIFNNPDGFTKAVQSSAKGAK